MTKGLLVSDCLRNYSKA